MQFIVLLFDGRPAGVDAPHKVPARLSAMHRGRRVAEKRTNEINSQEIVQYMVGARDDTRVS